MPQTTSWNIGVGVTCFIGAVGGMYLAYRGYKYMRKVKELQHSQNKNEFCPICNTKIDSLVDKNWISCINCDQIVCRKPKCAKWIASRGQEWECQLCHDQRRAHFKASEWLLTQLTKKLQISSALDLNDISVLDYGKQVIELNESDVNGTITDSQKEYIRAFLEDLLSTLLGGSLDNVLVGPIRKSSDYLPICDHECPGLAQAKLKRLIQKIIAEAARLPELLNQSGVPPRPEEHLPYFDPKKYNQLLATAVLNKVVDSYHNPRNPILNKDEFDKLNVDFNQNTVKPEKDVQKPNDIASKSSETPKTSAMKIENQRELLSPAAVSSASSQSVYSDDDSESSGQLLETLIKQQEKSKSRLPDLTSDETNDDEYHSIKSVATDSTWEDNWMFKTKKNTNDGSNSIAMLIPSPTEEVKVLIGDRTADEISDLSDNHDSDNDDEYSNSSDSLSDSDEPPKSPADIPNVLVHNKTVIGGKHPLTDFIENSSDFESLTSQNSFSEAKNDLLIEDGDYVKVDKPLLDIEYSTLDMKNGNVEKMKEAINPFVERKVDADSDEGAKKKVDDSVKVGKNAVSAVASEIQTTKEIVLEPPKPAQRMESKEIPINRDPLSQSGANNLESVICEHGGTKRKSSKGDTLAPNNASPKPDHDDDVDDDEDDDEDNGDDDDDDMDVNDSDFDLISVNSSEFSFHKPRNLNLSVESSLKSPIEKSKTSFDLSNEKICKEILEMVTKQPLDIVVSTIPAVKEETKITINQTIWQPRTMSKVDKTTWASENTSSTDDDEDLVEVNQDVNESMDDSSKPVVAAVSSVENNKNIATIEKVSSVIRQNTNESVGQSAREPVKNEQDKEDKLENTNINDQLSKIADISREVEATIARMINDAQQEPLLNEDETNTISEHVIVKEYIPEETEIFDDNNINGLITTNDNTINENIHVTDDEILATPATDNKEERAIEDLSFSAQQQSEIIESAEINELIQKLETISLTENFNRFMNTYENQSGLVNTSNETIKLEEKIKAQFPDNINKSDEQILTKDLPVYVTPNEPISVIKIEETKIATDNKIERHIPTIEITPNTPVSITVPEMNQTQNENQSNVKNVQSLSVEFTTKPLFVNVTEEVRKIEENLQESEIVFAQPNEDNDKIERTSAVEPAVVSNELNESKTEEKSEQTNPEIPTAKIQILNEAEVNPKIDVDIQTNEPTPVIVIEEVQKVVKTFQAIPIEMVETPLIECKNVKEKIEEISIPICVEMSNSADLEEPEIDHALEPQFQTMNSQEKIMSNTPVAIQEESEIKFHIQTMDLREIEPNEPVSVIVTEEVRKIEKKLEETNTEITQQIDDRKPNEGSQTVTEVEEIKTDSHEVTIIVNASQTIEEKLEESVLQPQIQTTDRQEILTSEPISVIVTDDVRMIEEKLEVEQIETSALLPIKIEPTIQTTDLKVDEEVAPKEQISVITTEVVKEFVTQSEEVNAPIEEVSVAVNNSQIIETKLEKSVIEPQIQSTDLNEIKTTEPTTVVVTEEVRKIEEKPEEEQIETSALPPIKIEPTIQTTDLKVDEEVASKEQISVITTELVKEFVTQSEEVNAPIEEVSVAVNDSQIIENKLEESVIEPQIQTININEIPSEPISVIVTEEVRKIEKKLEEAEIETAVPTPIKFETTIQTTNLEVNEEIVSKEQLSSATDVNEIIPSEPLSVIVTDEVRKIEEKLEEAQIELSIPLHNKIEPQILSADIKELKPTESITVTVTKEVQKTEEQLKEIKVEESITLPIKIDAKIQTTDLEVNQELVHTELISEIGTEAVKEYAMKIEEVKNEMQEISVLKNDSQIIENKLEESVLEQQIQTTDIKEIIASEPIPVVVTEEVQKIEEKLEDVQIEAELPPLIKVEPKIQTTDLKVDEEVLSNEWISVGTIEVVNKEVCVTMNDNQIIEDQLKETIIEPQIQMTDIKEIQTRDPVSAIVTKELRKSEEKLEEIQIENTIPLTITSEPIIQVTDKKVDEEVIPKEQISVITTEVVKEFGTKVEGVRTEIKEVTIIVNNSQIIENNLEESIIEPQTQISEINEIGSYESEYVIVSDEVRKIEEKLEVTQNEEEAKPIPLNIEPKIQTTDLKLDEKVTPNEQFNISTESVIKEFDAKVEEYKKDIDVVTVKATENIELNLESRIIEPQATNLQESDVFMTELTLPKIKPTLENVPQVKLVEFQSVPISKLPSVSPVMEPSFKSEVEVQQSPPPIDTEFEIISDSEIKTIPIEIEPTLKSSKLVAGVTTMKVSTLSLTLQPIPTVIEKQLTPPKSEAVESNSLALNLEAIKQKPLGSRYSSPLFKPLLPTSPPPPVVKLTIVESPKATTNNTNTSTSNIIVDTATSPITKPTNNEDEIISVEAPFPGSIAEREHKKWENAVPIANNPYSVEVLERRLSQKSNENQTYQSKNSVENGKPVTQEKLLVDVFKAEVPTIKRFGRDYYINEAKKASGERLRRSELLNQQLHNDSTSSDDHASDSEYQKFQYVPAATEEFVENELQNIEYPIQKSKSSGDTNRLLNENIFAARPIMVDEDDPLLERAHRVEALSTDDRDFFLLPIQEAQMNIGFSSSEASSLRSPSSLSEDSDTARIYNLRSQEIKKVKEPERTYIPPEVKTQNSPKSPTILKTTPSFVSATVPPPAKLSITTKIMSKSVPMFDANPELNQDNKREIADDINNNIAIEEELKHVLPSVKNLAKAFTETKDKPAPGPINKPKTPWHSSGNLTKPVESEQAPPKSQPVKIAEPFIRPGYSISGRSISKQVKDELREITPKSVDSNNNFNISKVQSNTKVESPPRSPSPTPVPGALRNTLAFFENLNK